MKEDLRFHHFNDGTRTPTRDFPFISSLSIAAQPLLSHASFDFFHLLVLFMMQSEASGYDPKRSRVNDTTMMDFIRGVVSADLTTVPGIGPAAAKKLATGEGDEKVTNTYQLIGKVSAS